MSGSIFQLVFVALVLGSCSGQSDECAPPTSSQLEEVIGLIFLAGDSAAAPTVNLMNSEIVCSGFGEQEGLLRQVSVIVEYTCTGYIGCPSDTATEQIESQCNGGNWTSVVGGSTDDVRLQSPIATLTTPDRDDCAFCLSPDKAVSVNAPAPDDVTHCVACNSSCEGLGRCSGLDDSDCCNYYNSSLCVDVCPTPFTPNSDNNCDCPEGTTGFNCTDVVDCGDLTDPDNGEVTLTDTVFDSVATYSCDPGYVLDGDATQTCLGSGLWSGSEPTCTDTTCAPLGKPTNGDVAYSNELLVNSVATYSCNDEYTLNGNATRICRLNSQWSGSEPTCERDCQVEDCLECDKDVTVCDVCSGDKVFDRVSQQCVVGTEQCESCDDCTGLVAGVIVLAILLLIALVAIAILVVFILFKILGNSGPKKKGRVSQEMVKPEEES